MNYFFSGKDTILMENGEWRMENALRAMKRRKGMNALRAGKGRKGMNALRQGNGGIISG
ncbi:MAG: hypothetical protein LBU42_07345 [Prevotellaceae bacterium]|jgi:hypothetical protein|nr:hypothetical protein [Prevotellaceae bacterium]